MSGATTRKMISAYFKEGMVTSFLMGFFVARPENFHDTEEIELDIQRSDEDIAIVVTDVKNGYRQNTLDGYTNKSFKPPAFKESFTINSFSLLKRQFGETPFASKDFRLSLLRYVYRGMRLVERKVRRSIELMASQVLTTGVVTLVDADGNTLYTIDFKAKASHFPTSGTAWGQTGDSKIADLGSLLDVIRDDSLEEADILIFGRLALDAFLKDDDVKDLLDLRRADRGQVAMNQVMGNGGKYHGTVEIQNRKVDIWSYNGRYVDPSDGTKKPYIPNGKVVALASTARLDLSFGSIPNIGRLLGIPSVLVNQVPELPGRVNSESAGMDMYPTVFLDDSGENLKAGVGARPLVIPTDIDAFGCLDTGL